MSRSDLTAPPPNESSEAVATGLSLGSRHWAICQASGANYESLRFRTQGSAHTAPSILVPRFGGEPLRLDTHFPTHPRGSGQDWPPEARVGAGIGSGRFPLAAAWSGRREGFEWHWTVDNERQSVRSIDAVAAAFHEFLEVNVRSPECALIIPNDLQQQEQQRILDTCFGVGPNVVLIWRPVAAALAVLDTERLSLPKPSTSGGRPYELCVVHADWGHIECTRLQVTPWPNDDPVRWVPARRRPQFNDRAIPGFGWAGTGTARHDALAEDWARSFATNAQKKWLTTSSRTDASQSNLLRAVSGWQLEQSTSDACASQVGEFLASSEGPVAGLVVVGDFAEELVGSVKWGEAINVLEPNRTGCTLVIEPGVKGEKLLSYGAVVHLRKLVSGEVSYLDTLPSLELFVDRNGSYEWYGLLGRGDQFVQGGKEWTLPEPVRGLAVRRGTTRVKLVVAHEEFHGVRELSATLGESAEQRIPAELHVSCTPAQGNAKLLLQMESQGELPSRSIRANWDRMTVIRDKKGNELDKEAYLQAQPRAFPELMARRSSHSKWNAALPRLKRLIAAANKESLKKILQDDWFLHEVKACLMQKDQAQTPHDATAIGSDFTAPFGQRILVEATETLLRVWRVSRNNPDSNVSMVVRILGYLSVDDTEFESWLIANLHNQMRDSQCVLHSCGLALRNPVFIAQFLEHVFPADRRWFPNANQLKAVSQVLRYRSEATREVSSEKAAQIITTCLLIFEDGMERGGGGYPFRWSSLIIVYLLRRRMHDHDFLDPEGVIAHRAKRLFGKAIERHERGNLRPLGGSVDLPAALLQMIDYIDKKGSGDVLMAAE